MILRSLAGGIAAAVALYLVVRVSSSPSPAESPEPATEVVAESASTPEVEFWVDGRQITSADDLRHGGPRPQDEVIRELYTMHGAEMREAQRQRLEEGIQHGEDIDDDFLERAGLPRHDNTTVLQKMETDGVVLW